MRLIRYEVITPSGNRTGLINSVSFLNGSQYDNENDAIRHIYKLTRPFRNLVDPHLANYCEFRFFFTNLGDKRFSKSIKAIAKQAKIDGWTPIKQLIVIKDKYLPKEVYRDENQIAWYLKDIQKTPKTVTERMI